MGYTNKDGFGEKLRNSKNSSKASFTSMDSTLVPCTNISPFIFSNPVTCEALGAIDWEGLM